MKIRYAPSLLVLLFACTPAQIDRTKSDTGPVIDTGVATSDAGQDPFDAGEVADGGLSPDAGTPNSGPRDAGTPDAGTPDAGINERFSFFVTSLQAIRRLSGSQDGFGGDLGGLAGADGICQSIADDVGVGYKEWRAFLSVTDGGDGNPVHAIDRIGEGPWYDPNGRLIASNVNGLLGERPDGDAQAVQDMVDEFGVPVSSYGDSHDTLTGSNRQGRLGNPDPRSTCDDWTSAADIGGGFLMCGHSWPRSARSGRQWIQDHPLRGCLPGVNLIDNGPGTGNCVGCSGGYGGFYCFALSP